MREAQAVFGPIADFERTGPGYISLTNVDVGLLVRRLVLFDKVILRSVRLRELPVLVRAFGESGLRSLISAGLLHFFATNCMSSPMSPGTGSGTFHNFISISELRGWWPMKIVCGKNLVYSKLSLGSKTINARQSKRQSGAHRFAIRANSGTRSSNKSTATFDRTLQRSRVGWLNN
jgi:hypothetical protein